MKRSSTKRGKREGIWSKDMQDYWLNIRAFSLIRAKSKVEAIHANAGRDQNDKNGALNSCEVGRGEGVLAGTIGGQGISYLLMYVQRQTFRDTRPCTTACPMQCTVRKTYFVLGWPEQPRQDKRLLYRHKELKEPTKEGPLSFVLLRPHSAQFQQSIYSLRKSGAS
jgi:hypothetical protein